MQQDRIRIEDLHALIAKAVDMKELLKKIV